MTQRAGSRRSAGRPRLEELTAREDELLSQVEALIVERGYEHVSLNLIARTAGVSKQTIYVKYGGKVGLLRAVLKRISDYNASTSFKSDDDLSLEEGLFSRAWSFLKLNKSLFSVRMAAITLKESRFFPEYSREIFESGRTAFEKPLQKYLENSKEKVLFEILTVRKLLESLFGCYQRI